MFKNMYLSFCFLLKGVYDAMVLLLLKQLIELFLMIGAGFLLVNCSILKSSDSKVLSLVCIYIVLPCVMIHAFQVDYSEQIRAGFLLAIAAAILIHLLLFLMTAFLGKLFSLDRVERASLIYSNAGNLVIPLVASILGEDWVIYASAFIVVQSIFLWTHGASLMRGTTQFELKRILTNINLIAIVIGIVLFFAKIRLPDIVDGTMSQISSMLGPISMIMIGMLLGDNDWNTILGNHRLYGLTFLKMVVIPAAALALLKFSGISRWAPHGDQILMITLLAVIAPSAATITQLAQLYEFCPVYAGAINIMTTLVCIVTIPLMVSLYSL